MDTHTEVHTRSTDMLDSDPDIIILRKRLDEHLEDYCSHRAIDQAKHEKWLERHDKTMLAIEHLTTSTQGVVDAWTFANNLRKFIQWLSGFAVVGVMITWYVKLTGKG